MDLVHRERPQPLEEEGERRVGPSVVPPLSVVSGVPVDEGTSTGLPFDSGSFPRRLVPDLPRPTLRGHGRPQSRRWRSGCLRGVDMGIYGVFASRSSCRYHSF